MIKQQKKPLPIGIDDFKKVQEGGFFYSDKTALIEELFDYKHEVTLLCRPRRFGKTLNLSMLSYFFDITEPENRKLFASTAIYTTQTMRDHQGAYPVIFLTFKNIQEKSYQDMYASFKHLIAEEFKRHKETLFSSLLQDDKDQYQSIINKQAGSAEYSASLFFLSRLLSAKYKKNCIVLIDEYDSPIHAAYTHGYYDDAVIFIKTVLGSVLKSNKFLERAVLTGILRTAKEGVFSGLNNLTVCTLLENKYTNHFGFTEPEVIQLLEIYALSDKFDKVKSWYNGYAVGETTKIYNPWSLLNFVESPGLFRPYWVNTASNTLLKQLIARANVIVKEDIQELLAGKSIERQLEESFTFAEIEHNSNALWALFFFSGYLTFSSKLLQENGHYLCKLIFPNYEIKTVYKDLIESLFIQVGFKGVSAKELLIQALVSGDVATFSELLQKFIRNSMSYYDLDPDEPEKTYHVFVLGLLVLLEDVYTVKSNRESGYGRYDIMLIPHNRATVGIIIEFKKARKEQLQKAAQEALLQIEEKKYAQELQNLGITKIIAYGIACAGKDVLVLMQDLMNSESF